MKEITNIGEWQTAMGEEYILVDFYAQWCQPCKMLKNVLITAEKELQSTLKNVYTLDVESKELEEISTKYQIRALPTMILFKNGVPFKTSSGVLNKQRLLSFIEYKDDEFGLD